MRRAAATCAALGLVPATTSLAPTPLSQAQPAMVEWTAAFEGDSLDTAKWERFTFEGGSGGTFKVEGGQLRMRGVSGARSGVRTKQKFGGTRFIVEASLAKVAAGPPDPGQGGLPLGTAVLTILFDDSGRNRVEWILTSEGTFEAWAIVNGRDERIDNRKLATKIPNPTLGIVRRGDEFLFVLNGQTGLQKTVKNLPKDFWVMLYGFGSSENNWSSVRVVTVKQTQ
jgi:NADPH-dependent glutamate synthase beta subunit-like oxidoreductase